MSATQGRVDAPSWGPGGQVVYHATLTGSSVLELNGKPLTGGGFLHEHFNDMICVPFWLPILLWLSKKAGLRKTDAPPLLIEVLVPTAGWSVIFEIWLPMLSPRFIGDPWDMTWYLLGGMGAYYFWCALYPPATLREAAT